MSKDEKAGVVFLTREAALAAAKRRKVRDVQVERLGGVARLRELSTREMMAFRKEYAGKDNEEAGMALLALCWVGEDDEPLFSGESGLEALGDFPTAVLNELSEAVVEVNGIAAGSVEAAEKN